MEALLEADLPGTIAAVLSNVPDAGGLEIARTRGIATAVVDHRAYPDRETFDDALAAEIERHRPHLVVLAGFMRKLTAKFVSLYSQRMLNIHPSLLPAFPGLHTHRAALEAGVRVHGCTVHFVTPALDEGPIVLQAAVPVLPDDTEGSLAARVLAQEHRIYPQAVRWFCEDRLHASESGLVRVEYAAEASGALVSPPLDA